MTLGLVLRVCVCVCLCVQLHDISMATTDPGQRQLIFQVLWERMKEAPANWRKVFIFREREMERERVGVCVCALSTRA